MGLPVVRDVLPTDCPAIVGLVRDLARYEKSEGSVEMSVADLEGALFGPHPRVFCLVAEIDGTVAGMALYFFTFSTWTGKPGLFLEDFFVLPEHRRRGLGKELFSALAGRAVAAGCGRFEWAVLDWNELAIGFYRSLGAEPMGEWTTYRLSGPAFSRLAAPSGG